MQDALSGWKKLFFFFFFFFFFFLTGIVETKAAGVKLRYFAWVRERVGKPGRGHASGGRRDGRRTDGVASRQGEGYAHAFENPKVIRAAIDRMHVRPETAIAGAGEIAFFPPMTGG